MGRYVSEIYVLGPDDLTGMIVAASFGSSEARMLSRIVFDWIAQVGRTKPGKKPLCLNCDAECLDDPEWSIVVTKPYATAKGKAIVSCICPVCAARDDITAIVTAKVAELHGGGYAIAEGRS
ncbi:MAG: hypothetical protein AUI16_27740 [Alphaproteobacteria bacterium 13_2_20CM_2_64_7]|jgi:hypothetical protein|nr:MAG: hypothetical protein AUI16_27740 [Alphaproteobacteria bacterium 13_2_20CM_2_64_7]